MLGSYFADVVRMLFDVLENKTPNILTPGAEPDHWKPSLICLSTETPYIVNYTGGIVNLCWAQQHGNRPRNHARPDVSVNHGAGTQYDVVLPRACHRPWCPLRSFIRETRGT